MTDITAAAFQRDGDPAFATESTEEETSADSQSENDNQEGDTHSSDGENSQSDDKTPFHEHPRWKQREEEWNTRFNEQETRHQTELTTAITSIREEFKGARENNAQQTKIPAWFGGTQEQWDAYRADRDAELAQAEERATERAKKDLGSEKDIQEKAVKEATDFLRSEITAIEADKTLNPTGAKIDAEKLFKTVFDNQLVDTQGRWNYRAGFRLMQGSTTVLTPKPKPNTAEKKEIAAASSGDTRGGDGNKDSAIATSETFKKSRPW